MDPKTDVDIDNEDDDSLRYTRVKIWNKAVLDYDIPVTVTIEIEQKYISKVLADTLYKEGWISC
jgi:hypothetical protein